jgi:hypothetical protein
MGFEPIALNTYRKIKELEQELWILNDELNFYIRKMDMESFELYFEKSEGINNNSRDDRDKLIEKKWKRIQKAKEK